VTSIRVIPADRLAPDLIAAWSEIQRANPLLASPFFHPEFTRAVASVRNDVEIAVFEDAGKPCGFFPFQRRKSGVGLPLGGRLSDFHGLIAADDAAWDVRQLLRGCGLRAWHFDHLICQRPFERFCFLTEPSRYMDISAGFDAYRSSLRQRGSESIEKTTKKARKMEREVGPLRFEMQTTDSGVLAQLIAWKRAQYQQTGVNDVFSYPWTVALLEKLLCCRSEGFCGVLSAIYAGNCLAAAHVGMRAGVVYHWWFPAYNHELARYSPGMILLLEFAKRLGSQGGGRIDLGKGNTQFKLEMANGSTDVAEGCADRSAAMFALRRGWRKTRLWLRDSPLRPLLHWPAKLVRRLRGDRQLR
jgi:CelD/BcsL family acetyltransferase involved in cellulose biosynthesis